ncbi:hypothetical protein ACOKM5_17180 [Streptomyces sp. BH097]|uniref:hypothetical protein n=1 Tax=unclassified Streptomyces TaxID=2593676 RepID=UPI003BB70390
MSTSEREGARAVSMRDLLASCAAARAVSTPPNPPRRGDASLRRDGVADSGRCPGPRASIAGGA